jgi:hypothetical protein
MFSWFTLHSRMSTSDHNDDDDDNDALPPLPAPPALLPVALEYQGRGSVHFHYIDWSGIPPEPMQAPDVAASYAASYGLPSSPIVLAVRSLRSNASNIGAARRHDWAGSLRTEGLCICRSGHFYVGVTGHLGHTQFECSSCRQAHPANSSIEAHLMTQAGPDSNCIICLSGFQSAGDCVTACVAGHLFHRQCLANWLVARRAHHFAANCPLCNRKADPVPYGCRQ